MRLTTKGRYAVTALLDLAIHASEDPIPLADVARRQGISLAYLEQLFTRLRRLGLVTSARGPGGGYTLLKPADAISVAEVLAAVEEGVDATRCGGEQNCQNDERCLTHDLWYDLSHHIESFLTQVTLADLAQRPGVRDVAMRQDELTHTTSVASGTVIPLVTETAP
jgi:Rrf2 family transcriptional regulator, iron-sulfur cluster assembly transcription factor